MTGLEPASDLAVSVDAERICEFCPKCRAALALHSGYIKRRLLASFDAELQTVICGWEYLPEAIRSAIVALIDANWHNKS